MACVPQFSLRNTDFCDSSFRGGLKRIYLAHREGNGSNIFGFNDISGVSINSNPNSADYGYVTLGTISAGGPVFAEIKFNKKDGVSVFNDIATSSPDGLENIVPSITFEMEGMNQQTSALAYKILKSKDIVALIETAADTWHLVGVDEGMEVEEVEGTTGASYNEKNRIRVRIVGGENEFSRYLYSKSDFDRLIELTEASSLSIESQLSIYDSEIVNGSLFPFQYQTGLMQDGCYQVALSGGTGSGAEANVCFVGGQTYLDMITITDGGNGYLNGDVLEGNFVITSSGVIDGNYTLTTNSPSYPSALSNSFLTMTKDGGNYPAGFRMYLQANAVYNISGGTGINSIIMVNSNGVAPNPVQTFHVFSGGSGYSYGDVLSLSSFNGIKTISLISSTIISSANSSGQTFANTVTGTGLGAAIQWSVNAGTLTSYSIDSAYDNYGYGYAVGDEIEITTFLGDYMVFSVDEIWPDSSNPDDDIEFRFQCSPSYNNITLTGGSGSGAKANFTMNQATGQVSSMTISTEGSGYQVGDILSYSFAGGAVTGSIEIDSMPSGDIVSFVFDINEVYNWKINSGESFLFTVVVTNNGQSTINNVMVEYDPPVEMSNVRYILNAQSTYYLDWLGAVNIGTLTAGQDAEIVFLCTVSGAFNGNSLNTIVASTLNGQISEDITIEVLP